MRTHRPSAFGDAQAVIRTLADGDHLGDEVLTDAGRSWPYTAAAATSGTLLALPATAFADRDWLTGWMNRHGHRITHATS